MHLLNTQPYFKQLKNITLNKYMREFSIHLAKTISKQIQEYSKNNVLWKVLWTIWVWWDETKSADNYVEKIVIHEIEKYSQNNDNIFLILISEETWYLEFWKQKNEDWFFIILDPIDGSNNMRPWRTPWPYVACSIAIWEIKNLNDTKNLDRIDIAVISDIFHDRIYIAEKNKWAHLLEYWKIQTSPLWDLSQSIVWIDLDLQDKKQLENIAKLTEILTQAKCQRRLWSSILDMTKLACGEYDSFVSLWNRMKLHDIAAVSLLIKESGWVFDVLQWKLKQCMISQIIYTKNASLLEKNRFVILSSWNIIFQNKVLELLQSNS